VPEEELTCVGDAWRPVEVVPVAVDVVPDDVEELAVAPLEVVVVPGSV
jgi:hypothetical protein